MCAWRRGGASRGFAVTVWAKMRLCALLAVAGVFCFVSGALAETAGKEAKEYTFTTDWFSHNIPMWKGVLGEMKGKPDLRYLEIGVWEGRSFFWVLDNILTHPSSEAVAIDIFDEEIEKRFLENARISGRSSKIKLMKGYSRRELRDLRPNSFDLIYVDGDHTSKGVLTDAILAWDLLKDNGILIFDDYKLFSGLPVETRPELAIDVFLTLFRDECRVLARDYQVILQKTRNQCDESAGFVLRLDNKIFCSHIGPYVYYWKPQRLYEAASKREVAVSRAETAMIEKALLFLKMGFRIEVDRNEVDQYRRLLDRLGITGITVSPKAK